MRSSSEWPAKGKSSPQFGEENLLKQASSAAEHVKNLIGEAGQAIDETRREELYRIAASTEQVILTIHGEQTSIDTFDLRCFHERLRSFSAVWKGTVTGTHTQLASILSIELGLVAAETCSSKRKKSDNQV